MIENFLEPDLRGLALRRPRARAASRRSRSSSAPRARSPASRLAYLLYVRSPARRVRLAAASARLHGFLVAQVVLRRALRLAVVRPMRALGRAASNVVRAGRDRRHGAGAALAVRAGNSLVRVAPVRPPALLRAAADDRASTGARPLLPGGGALMLSVLIFLPLAGGVIAALLPGGRAGGRAAGSCRCSFARLSTLGHRDRADRRLRHRRARPPARDRLHLDLRSSASTTSSASTA